MIVATAASSGLFYLYLAVRGLGGQESYSWGMQLIDCGLAFLLLAGVRILYRHLPDVSLLEANWFRNGWPLRSAPRVNGQRALIVGAGDTGETVARELKRRPQEGIVPIGFVDDNALKQGIQIQGIPVLGTSTDIPDIVARWGADIILIAIPGISGETLRHIVSRCELTRARLCIVPSVTELLDEQTGRSGVPGHQD